VVLLTIAGLQLPVMPLVDSIGSTGAVAPEQKAGTAANAGVTLGVTVISRVAVVAHCPASGVNVYVPEVVLLTVAGLQVPVMPSVEVVGNTGAVAPEQKSGTAAKPGVIWLVTVMLMVVATPQLPASGVNVYVIAPSAEVLMVAGLQLPVMPLLEVAGNAGATLFRHNGPMVLKTGVTELSMVTSMDALLAH
jgi:hypothetical protein